MEREGSSSKKERKKKGKGSPAVVEGVVQALSKALVRSATSKRLTNRVPKLSTPPTERRDIRVQTGYKVLPPKNEKPPTSKTLPPHCITSENILSYFGFTASAEKVPPTLDTVEKYR